VSRRLAVVVAHPDDDAFGVTGTAALHADDPEFHLVAVLATSGERGMISDPSLATPETLGAVREAEDAAGWRALDREPDRLEFLRYPDHAVEDVPFDELVERITVILREDRPDVVVTFGSDGITGHPDHIRVGEATSAAFHLLREEGHDGFRRLLHVGLPEAAIGEFNRMLVERGMPAFDPTQLYQPRGVPDETIAVVVDCSEVWERKRAAVKEHRTKANDTDFPPDVEERVYSTETFVQAWPERAPGERALADVFEGLEAPAVG